MNSISHNQGPPLFDRHPDDHMRYVQWNIRDFLHGVRGMKPDQIGMYSIILLLIYESMGMLRDEDRYIAGHLQLDIRYYRKLRQQLIDSGKIYEADGYLYNNRALSEIAKFCESSKRTCDAAVLREAKKRAAAANVDERASGAPQAPDARASRARHARVTRASRAPHAPVERAVRSEKPKFGSENNHGESRQVPETSIQREIETEIERKNRQQQPAEPPAAWSDVELRGFVKRLEAEAGDALANPAGAAGLLNISPIVAWLHAGADPEYDIVTAVRMVSGQARVRNTQKIRSWEYFNTAVADCRMRRLRGLPAVEIRTKPGAKAPDPSAGLTKDQRARVERAQAEAAARGSGHA